MAEAEAKMAEAKVAEAEVEQLRTQLREMEKKCQRFEIFIYNQLFITRPQSAAI